MAAKIVIPSMIPPLEFREAFIRPTLDHLSKTEPRIACRASERLMLGTALIESMLKFLRQIGGGPAITFWGIEPPTFDDTYNRYLQTHRPDLREAVDKLRIPVITNDLDQLLFNPLFACAIARCKYWMSPVPLPEAMDLDGLGFYWDNNYNTPDKGLTDKDFVRLYLRYIPKGE